jgi:hypothetical protein
MWFKQVTASSAVIIVILPREKALNSALILDIEYFQACNVRIVGFKLERGVVYKTVSGEHKSWTAEQQRNGERNRYLKW